MSGRVVLHIGAMKTGTSFIQSMFLLHRDEFAAAGVEFVGTFHDQLHAVQHALRAGKAKQKLRPWRHLVGAASEHSTNVVSMEFLSFARGAQVSDFLRPLRGREVDVVLTVRDQQQVLSSQWQTYVRNRGTAGWDQYLRDVCAPHRAVRPSGAYLSFHRAQDLSRIIADWAGQPAVSRFTVATVPSRGVPREELWLRFCRAADITLPAVSYDLVKDNVSIGYASCDVLRRLNTHLVELPVPRARYTHLVNRIRHSTGARGKGVPGYGKLVKNVALDALAPLRVHETNPALDRAAATYAVGRNNEFRELLVARDIPVVGSLDELPVMLPAGLPAKVPPPPPEQLLRAAQAVWDYAASVAGETATRPGKVPALISDAGRMLRGVAEQRVAVGGAG